MMTNEIETPAVVIDEAIASQNIKAFQAYCNKHGLNLRPHIKTHKLPHFAKMQLAAGAQGITCQKIGEAEVMADAGVRDILITFNILGEAKLKRLRTLSDRLERLSVTVDSKVTIDGLGSVYDGAARPLNVLIECDTGAGRCGVQTPQQAVELAKCVARYPGLNFDGLMTYPPAGGTKAVNDFMAQTPELLKADGLDCSTVSSGGSPDMWLAHEQTAVNEYRIGTYIYNDRSLVEHGTCAWSNCAISVLATVVSTPTPGRSVIDAGSKVLTSDLPHLDGYGHVVGYPDIRVASLSEEHGVLHHNESTPFTVGERISIIPNHACVVSNMVNAVHLLAENGETNEVTVAARGLVT